MSRRSSVLVVLCVLVAGFGCVQPVRGGNGHFLHGVGAVNSSMGGAGVAVAADSLGALNLNPALLTKFEGDRVDFGFEALSQSLRVSSKVGPFAGSTDDDTGIATLPAFGWVHRNPGSRRAFGFGFLALAGFQTDYPQDSSNPVLQRPPTGFGRTLADYQFAKIPLTVAWQVSPQLSLGVSLQLGQAGLDSAPFAGATPDCSSPTDCYYPSAVPQDSVFGAGFQLGVLYEVSPRLSFGASYSSPMSFENFEWHSTVANPNLPTFGQGRVLEFDLDSPQRATVGLAVAPRAGLDLALDLTWINYSGTDGFSGGNLDPRTGAIDGLGWEDIFVVAGGVQWTLPSGFSLRGGINISEAAVPERLAFFNIQAPAIQENHLTLGVGVPATPRLVVNLAYYHVFEASVTGPVLSPNGPIPGSEVTSEISIDSLLTSLSFTF